MNDLFGVLAVVVAVVFIVWMSIQIVGCMIEICGEVREMRVSRHSNYIVIKGKKYYPKRMGVETDCKNCSLYNLCEKGSHSICITLQHPYDDVIMTENDGKEQ